MNNHFTDSIVTALLIISVFIFLLHLDIKNRNKSKNYRFYKKLKMRIKSKECIYRGRGGASYIVSLYSEAIKIEIQVDKNTYKLCGDEDELFPYEILVYKYDDSYTGLPLNGYIKNKFDKIADSEDKENIIYHKLLTRSEKAQVILFLIFLPFILFLLKTA